MLAPVRMLSSPFQRGNYTLLSHDVYGMNHVKLTHKHMALVIWEVWERQEKAITLN